MNCPICKKKKKPKKFSLIHKYIKKKNVQKKEYQLDISYCLNCCHGFIDDNKIVYNLIYPKNNFSDSIKNSKNIYSDIINFIEEYKFNTCCDLGGDDGSFFNELLSKTDNIKKFTIYDMRPFKRYKKFNYINLNLNKIDSLKKIKFHDFTFLIHTLEHIKNPLEFLSALQKLQKFKHVYIEVPSIRFTKVFTSVGMVGAQHLHYFTINSLTNILRLSGFEVEKIQEKITNGVPRLMCVASVNKKDYLSNYTKTEKRKLKKLSDYIIEKKPYLYGCGDIFEKIINNKIKMLIHSNLISIFDKNLGGKMYDRLKIKQPFQLKNLKNNEVLILPVYRDVQSNIKVFLKKLKIKNKIVIVNDIISKIS